MAVQLADADNPMTGSADDRGRSYAVWTLGLAEGVQTARVASGLTGVPTEFQADATTLHADMVSVGSRYACAILADRRPVCWGANRFGSLGTGDTTSRTTPTPVVGLPGALEIQASTSARTCARDLAGDVWCWGWSGGGASGPAAEPVQLTPVRVPGAEGASMLATPLFYDFTCALIAAGGAKCWGVNWGGQLGTGDFVPSSTPRLVAGSDDFRSIFSGENRVCALDSGGEAWCWGRAAAGELSPLPGGSYPTPTRPVPGTTYAALAVGYWAVCGIERGGGSSCFGNWGDFSLGTSYPPRELRTSAPVRPETEANLRQIVYNGDNAVFALSRYGETLSWGDLNPWPLPTFQVIKEPRLTQIAGGGVEFCGIAESGGVYCGETATWWSGTGTTVRGVPATLGP